MKGTCRLALRLLGLLVCFFLFASIGSSLSAQEYTAITIESGEDVSVMKFVGSYDFGDSDHNDAVETVTNEFYATHSDNYDFLIIFSDFEFEMPQMLIDGVTYTAAGFYNGVRNDVEGIGNDIFDYSSYFGSSSKLQGLITIGYVDDIVTDPLEPDFGDTMELLSHEFLHRWSAKVNFEDTDGAISDALLGYANEQGERAHWSSLLDTDGSVLYGNDWVENGDGTFTSMAAKKYYSPLDLYLMGLIGKDDVPQMLLIENSSLSRERLPEVGITTEGTARYITIQEIIDAEGERIPDYESSQKEFKIGVVFLTRSETADEGQLYNVENIIEQWILWVSALTDGRATIRFSGGTSADIPENPGTTTVPVDPRDLPYALEEGVSWLMAAQEAEGNWADAGLNSGRNTVEAIRTLADFTETSEYISKGAEWLENVSLSGVDYIAGKMTALGIAGNDVASLADKIVGLQNQDGGWGSDAYYLSNSLDTSLALRGLSSVGYSDTSVIEPVFSMLVEMQNTDGGWGLDSGESDILTTVSVLDALGLYTDIVDASDPIQKGLAWLMDSQNTDGGFGEASSTVYDTAEALIVIKRLSEQYDVIENALDYLKGTQSKNGSWHDSPYQTALAVFAIWSTMQETDLSITTGNISVSPETITQLPAELTVTAKVRNLGLTAAENVTVAIYDGAVSEADKVSEQVISIDGDSNVEVSFNATITDGTSHQFYIVVDPENLIAESSTSNNTAMKIVECQATMDFEILDSDLDVTPLEVELLSPMVITATIRNNGTVDASDVPVAFRVEDDGEAYLISMESVDIPAGGSVTREITWEADRSGEDLVISVTVDPSDYTNEVSEDNNQASVSVVVNPSTKPNFYLDYEDISFSDDPAMENGSVDISAVIRNNGASTDESFEVLFYNGAPDVGGVVIGTQAVTAMAADGSVTVVNCWDPIDTAGDTLIYIQIDPENQVDEIDETDNDSFESFTILGLPDLLLVSSSISFSPQAPKEGDTVSVTVTVLNNGGQEVTDVPVVLSEDGETIASGTISSIPGYSNSSISFDYDTTGKNGVCAIEAAVDPENAIVETDESNNEAERVLGVQDSSLWISERYISPNGDGVKDDTQFFFTLSEAETVHVEIENRDEEVVRSFSGDDYENILSGDVKWDGLDDEGSVVPDGEYQLNVLSDDGTLLKALVVTVDTDRSLLFDAIGTKYWLKTGPMPFLEDLELWEEWEWLPDDSGILFYLDSSRTVDEELYTAGIYTMSPFGDDIQRIVPDEWSTGVNPIYDYNYCNNEQYNISPDGGWVALILDKYNNALGETEESQLWVVNLYDGSQTLIDARDATSEDYWEIRENWWSPDGSKLAYKLHNADTEQYEIIIRDLDTDAIVEHFPDWDETTGERQDLSWSPDSSLIAYATDTEIVLIDMAGDSRSLLEIKSSYVLQDWLDNDTLMVRDNNDYESYSIYAPLDIWIVDVTGDAVPRQLAEAVRDMAIQYAGSYNRYENGMDGTDVSPQGDWAIYALDSDEAIPDNYESYWDDLKIIDLNGISRDAHRLGTIGSSFWSPDGRKLIFSDTYWDSHLSIYDTETFTNYLWVESGHINQVTEFPNYYVNLGNDRPAYFPYIFNSDSIGGENGQWLNDDWSIAYSNDESPNLGVFNIDTFEFVSLPIESVSSLLSPRGGNLMYEPGWWTSEEGIWGFHHLLNLFCYLSITNEETSLSIKGLAADLNFLQYELEYADAESPDEWNLIRPASDTLVLDKDEAMAQWTPPYEGTFYIRLTVTDKAGNTTWTRRRVTWGGSEAIVTNLYSEDSLFSPNEDGASDSFTLDYSVAGTAHLDFEIFDEDGVLVLTISKDHVIAGDFSVTWDGRDSSGEIVPDGLYEIVVEGISFWIEVDNTLPEAVLEITDVSMEKNGLEVGMWAYAQDENLISWQILYGEGTVPDEWLEYMAGNSAIEGSNIEDLTEEIAVLTDDEIHFLEGKTFRLVVEDDAGNKSVMDAAFEDHGLFLAKWEDPSESSWEICYPDYDPPASYAAIGDHKIGVFETISESIAEVYIQYNWRCMGWIDQPGEILSENGDLFIQWNNLSVDPEEYGASVRLIAVDETGSVYKSNSVHFGDTSCKFAVIERCEGFDTEIEITNPNIEFSVLTIEFGRKIDENPDSVEEYSIENIEIYEEYTIEYSVEKGDEIEASIDVSWPDDVNGNIIVVTGVDEDGNVYSKVDEIDFDCRMGVGYHYEEGDAYDYYSSGIAEIYLFDPDNDEDIYLSEMPDGVSNLEISCYLDCEDGFQFLKSQEIDDGDLSPSVEIDTNSIEEGRHEVKVILGYEYYGEYKEKEFVIQLVVDRTLPEATISKPFDLSKICPEVKDYDGTFVTGVPLSIGMSDSNIIERYEVYWGDKNSPEELMHAYSPDIKGKHDLINPPYYDLRGGGADSSIPLPIIDCNSGDSKTIFVQIDTSKSTNGWYFLTLKIVDAAGNIDMATTSFKVNSSGAGIVLSPSEELFSPNGDGVMDNLSFSYSLTGQAEVTVSVLDEKTVIRELVSNENKEAGDYSIDWDGRDDAGAVVEDGEYTIVASATDSCGNVDEDSYKVVVDTTPPVAEIVYPESGTQITNNTVEIVGNATDANPYVLLLEAVGYGGDGNENITSAEGYAYDNDVIGDWHTAGLEGTWNIRLVLSDRAGNYSSAAATVDFGERKTLLGDIDADPKYFSPNGDNVADSVNVQYELLEPCDVGMEIVSSDKTVVKSFTAESLETGLHEFVWAGDDNSGGTIPDGLYSCRITASLVDDPTETHEETVTVFVDATLPEIVLEEPSVSCLTDLIEVVGAISDENMEKYLVTLEFESETTTIAGGFESREGYRFSEIENPDEGDYTLTVWALDRAQNEATFELLFTVDNTPPVIELEAPVDGDVYGFETDSVDIIGEIEELNPESWKVRYGSGDDPEEWNLLADGSSLPEDGAFFTWAVGSESGLGDGYYTVSVLATDCSGLEGEEKRTIIIDNSPPVVEITFPEEDGYVVSACDIKGTVSDLTFDQYTLEIAPAASDPKWSVIQTATEIDENGILGSLEILPADGEYFARVTALDKVGNEGQHQIAFTIDTTPPSAPELSGTKDENDSVVLTWASNTEEDLAGYNLYRDGEKLNAELLTSTEFVDSDSFDDGTYTYILKAVDLAGWESDPSNSVVIEMDQSPPDVKITYPGESNVIGDYVDIKGTAYSLDDFKEYRLYHAAFDDTGELGSWSLIAKSSVSVKNGVIVRWDLLGFSDGEYALKLEAEDLIGNTATDQVSFSIDNTAPAAPVLLSANADGNTVTLTWEAGSETDLSGYLVYRNGNLVNSEDGYASDLSRYLISGTEYTDQDLPDGEFTYHIEAMDVAGNISGISNSLTVTIDTHAPAAVITVPEDGYSFDEAFTIQAESSDEDITALQFQYREEIDSEWSDISASVQTELFECEFDPEELGIAFGTYLLRAVATDAGGQTDSSPEEITVYYEDVTPPETPDDFSATVTEGDVVFTWTANSEIDLAGYNIYQVEESSGTKLNSELITDTAYELTSLDDGVYTYQLTALDGDGNESDASETVVTIYSPEVVQPYTPSPEDTQILAGTALAGVSVEMFKTVGMESISQGETTADENGDFGFTVALDEGENVYTFRATDFSGNISKTSDPLMVAYNTAPAEPEDITSNGDTSLTWTPNTETDIFGYIIYQDGQKMNQPSYVDTGTLSSSGYYPSKAFDSDLTTYAQLYDSDWWTIEFSERQLVSSIMLTWRNYKATDFKIQAWSGYAWITLQEVTDNTSYSKIYSFESPYGTEKIRILVVDCSYRAYLAEVYIQKENAIQNPPYDVVEILDGNSLYQVSAVDSYGYESPIAAEDSPVPPTGVAAQVDGDNVEISWNTSGEANIAGYNVYEVFDGGLSKLNSSPVNTNEYIVTDVILGTYSYQVTAVTYTGSESLPCNAVSATVTLDPEQENVSVTVSVIPEGEALEICWEVPDGDVVGYHLYRKDSGEGEYLRINDTLITDTCYTDHDLNNGQEYYYLVVAVDSSGNQTVCSTETYGTPEDTVLPNTPWFTDPTVAGYSMETGKSAVDISGVAELYSTVFLYQNGKYSFSTEAGEGFLSVVMNLPYGLGYELSPDASLVAYAYWDYSIAAYVVRLKNVDSGVIRSILENADVIGWSPDGAYLLYNDYSSGNALIGIYDVASGSSYLLNEGSNYAEYDAAWSPDSLSVVYACRGDGSLLNIWRYDVETGISVQITEEVDATYPEISQSGEYLAYYESGLKFYNISDGSITSADPDALDSQSFIWSPEEDKIAYISDQDGDGTIYLADMETGSTNVVSKYEGSISGFQWSVGGNRMIVQGEEDGKYDILSLNLEEDAEQTVLYSLDEAYQDLQLTGLDAVFVILNQKLLSVVPDGTFTFEDVALDVGTNRFFSRATDASGNESDWSDSIEIVLSSELMADLEVSEDRITFLPSAPIAGDNVIVSVVVDNTGAVDLDDVVVDIYSESPDGEMDYLSGEDISYLAAGADERVTFTWDTTEKSGKYAILVEVYTEEGVDEADDENNKAEKEIVVSQTEGISMDASIGSDQYGPSEVLSTHVEIFNSDASAASDIKVSILDGENALVALLADEEITAAYGIITELDYTWNTGATYSGDYSVYVVLNDSSGIIASNSLPFSILPDASLTSLLTTGKSSYGPEENVWISLDLENEGTNYDFPAFDVNIGITDDDGTEYLDSDIKVEGILAGDEIRIQETWNTESNSPGVYHVTATITLDSDTVVERSAMFTVEASDNLAGEISVSPVIAPGTDVRVTYAVTNSGNAALADLPIQVLILDPDTWTIVDSESMTVSLEQGETHSDTIAFGTDALSLKTYRVLLQYEASEETETLAVAGFTVRDTIGPKLSILAPEDGSVCQGSLALSVQATDDLSGVSAVSYRIDDGDWTPMVVLNASTGMYAATWTPGDSDEGDHTVGFRAWDGAGNVTEIASVAVEIVLSSAFETLYAEADLDPDSVYQGEPTAVLYTIYNEHSDAIDDLVVSVLINDPDTGEEIASYEETRVITGESDIVGSVDISTLNLPPAVYALNLVVYTLSGDDPRSLASNELEVKQAIDVEDGTESPVNLLIWVNKNNPDHDKGGCRCMGKWHDFRFHCHKNGHDEHFGNDFDDTIRWDLLEEIFEESASDYLIVLDRDDFLDAMRNPYFTDILILGDQTDLSGTTGRELVEKVYSGTGLVALQWSGKSSDNEMLGIDSNGQLSPKYSILQLLESDISNETTFQVNGESKKVTAMKDAVVAGWLRSERHGREYPAIVLNQFGLGKTVFCSFDLGASLNEEAFNTLSDLLYGAITYVHRNVEETAYDPFQIAPLEVVVKSLGAETSVRITTSFQDPLSLYDSVTGLWETESPWITDLVLGSEEEQSSLFYFLTPDVVGSYNVLTETGILADDEEAVVDENYFEISVQTDKQILCQEILEDLRALKPSHWRHRSLRQVISLVENVSERPTVTIADTERNIRDLLQAIEYLIKDGLSDETLIRLKLDRLLGIEQGRYYFLLYPVED